MTTDTGLTPEERENLVAYLDGELGLEATQKLDEELARNPAVRLEVEVLSRTWELLDVLPQAQASAEFTARTLTTIQAESSREDAGGGWSHQSRRGVAVIVWVALLAVSAVIGFVSSNRLLKTDADRLLEHLPLIARLDVYDEVQAAEFLVALSADGSFNSDDQPVTGTPTPRDDDSVSSRRTWVTAIPADQRERLKQNQGRFDALAETDPTAFDTLNRLHDSVSTSADLETVLLAYYNWAKTLTPLQREELRKTSDVAERVELVRTFREEQQQARKTLPDSPLRRYMKSFGPTLPNDDFLDVIKVIKNNLDAAPQRELESISGFEHDLRVLELSVDQANGEGSQPVDWPDPQLAFGIESVISDELIRQFLMAPAQGADWRRRELSRLLIRSLGKRRLAEFENQRPTEEQLQEMFVSLPRQERDKLMRLPPESLKRQLRWKYFRHVARSTTGPSPTQRLFNLLPRILPRSYGSRPGRGTRSGRRSPLRGTGPASREPRNPGAE